MTTVFHRVGRYEIHEQIGRGGMAVVFLATDTEANREVALKLVSIETDRDGQQVLEAERWGAKLQEEFCRESRYVPAVYEYGTHGSYFYLAMERLGGRNLSDVISEGPMPAARAVRIAIQLCEFLEAADAFERTLDGRQFNKLLHGDLKPRNIRVLDGGASQIENQIKQNQVEDEIKVFDFGIAKALSLSRKVTRNDFGSIAYLSPERLESGEIDAQAEFWAVGVLLYEMISGVQPFRAADTRRLEQRIRARQTPAPLDNGCPPALQAIVAKLLAAQVADRYPTAAAIRDDLQRFTTGEPVLALQPAQPDEAATRRTHRTAAAGGAAEKETRVDETEVTRRTTREAPSTSPPAELPTRPMARATAAVPPVATIPPAPAAVPQTPAARPSLFRRLRRLAPRVMMVIAIFVVLNEIRVYIAASALAENVPQDAADVAQLWTRYFTLQESGSLDLGVRPLDRALTQQSVLLSGRLFARYRSGSGTVYEREWRQARDLLAFALRAHPSRSHLEAAVKYCDGHLRRIDGEARVRDKQVEPAQEALTAAVAAFRQSAELRKEWPDPFLGLMRTFIVMDDVERGADALAQAQKYGYAAGNRDWALLGEGYLARAARLAESKELEPLNRAAEAYNQAIEHLSKAVGFGNVSQRLREARRRLKDVEERIELLAIPIDVETTS